MRPSPHLSSGGEGMPESSPFERGEGRRPSPLLSKEERGEDHQPYRRGDHPISYLYRGKGYSLLLCWGRRGDPLYWERRGDTILSSLHNIHHNLSLHGAGGLFVCVFSFQ
jgi:hypothetical protein